MFQYVSFLSSNLNSCTSLSYDKLYKCIKFLLHFQHELGELGTALSKDDVEKMILQLGEDLDPTLVSDDEAIVPDLDSISQQFIASQQV